MRPIFYFFLILCSSNAICNEPTIFSEEDLSKLLSTYDKPEQELILEDYAIIKNFLFRDISKPNGKPIYLATAGAPGSIKSTILETVMHEDPRFGNMVYIDPDQRALRFMIHTYLGKSLSNYQVSLNNDFKNHLKQTYEHWRDASNYIAKRAFETARSLNFNIAHGTTSTGDIVEKSLLPILQNQGYKIVILLCYTTDRVRKQAINFRNSSRAFYQNTEQDAIDKARYLPSKIPVYFKYADELMLFWTERFMEKSVKAATFKKNILTVHDEKYYEKIKTRYAEDKRYYNLINLPEWKDLIQ